MSHRLQRLFLALAVLLAAALPSLAQQTPGHLDQLRLLSEDLKIASNLAYKQAQASAPGTQVTTKIGAMAAQANSFYQRIPQLLNTPDQLIGDYAKLAQKYNAVRPIVQADAPAPVALTFQWVEMLMVKIGMYFGDSLSQSDFPPGAALPQGEMIYTMEGLDALAQQVYILSNQIYVIASSGGQMGPQRAQAIDEWLMVTNAAQSLQQGVDADLTQTELLQRFQNLSIAWQKAVPLFGNLNPNFTQKQDFAMLLSNYVRLRAAYGQLYSNVLWGKQDPGSVTGD